MLFNVNDWLTSKSVVRMTYEQRGMYLELLLFAWLDDEPGVLSADDETLAGILRIPVDEWACHSGPIGRAWDTVSRPGFWVQKRMVEEHARQVKFLERQRDLGARGAEKRWGAKDYPSPSPAHSDPIAIGLGVGLGVEVKAEATLNPTADAAGLPGSLARPRPNVNGTPRQRGTNSRAKGTNPRAQGTNPRAGRPWRPRRWYGQPRTEKLPAWYTPPGPLSVSSGGHTGIELPEPDVWRELTPKEFSEWQAAVIDGARK
jgi:uncharacterized protein YdaU (DUF1376 family)